MKKTLAVLLSALLFSTPLFAVMESPTQTKYPKTENPVVKPSEDFIKKIFVNKSFSEGIESITLTEDGTALSSAMGTLSSPLMGNMEKAVESYIRENAVLFNLPSNKRSSDILSLEKKQSSGNANHFVYRMKIEDIPVRDATIAINLDKDRAVSLVHGSLPTIKEIVNEVAYSEFQAMKEARKLAKVTKLRALPKAEVELLPFDLKKGLAKYVYSVKLPAQEPLGDWEVLLDAENYELISLTNMMVFAPNGKGACYPTNPLKSKVTVLPLHDLTSSSLHGKDCRVNNSKEKNASNPDNIHIYDPSTTHFDEVGAYHYISTGYEFYRSMGHPPMRNILVYVHYGDNYDNAFFSPFENRICFGAGNKLNNLAREAAVAYHEFAHATLATIVRLAYSKESGAINEGQADYFGCSITDDPIIGEWVCQKISRPHLRNLEDDLKYPKDIKGEVHADGRIWGTTLWDIRKAIGKKDADLLIYKSLFYLKPGSPTFMDGFNALISADKDNFNGKYAKRLSAIFTERGITPEAYKGAVLTNRQVREIRNFNEIYNK